jgi:hypothetical protein
MLGRLPKVGDCAIEVATTKAIGGRAEEDGDALDTEGGEPLADVELLWALLLICLPGSKDRLLGDGDRQYGLAASVVGESLIKQRWRRARSPHLAWRIGVG